MNRFLYILPLLFLYLCLPARAEVLTDVPCGEWITIEAHPFEDHIFVRWSDGNTDTVRTIQVNEDATYIAYFSSLCGEYANWPVISLYDWLLMVNVAEINKAGYFVSPENVTWYRVVGEPDDMHAEFPQNDRVMARGSYYLTLDKSLKGTGSYYAVVDVSNAQGMLCDGFMRTVIVNYSGSAHAPQLRLVSNSVRPGQQLRLVGLTPDETAVIQVYSSAGQLLRSFVSSEAECLFPAESAAGCYHVRVSSPSVSRVLKYLVQY